MLHFYSINRNTNTRQFPPLNTAPFHVYIYVQILVSHWWIPSYESFSHSKSKHPKKERKKGLCQITKMIAVTYLTSRRENQYVFGTQYPQLN